MPLNTAVLAGIILERDSERERVFARQVQQRAHEIVPRAEKVEQRHDHQDRPAQRHDNPPEKPRFTAPVNPRSFAEFFRNCAEELPHQENIKRIGEKRRQPIVVEPFLPVPVLLPTGNPAGRDVPDRA